MSEEKYFASDHESDFERTRLALSESAYDPDTIRQLEALGVSEGWRCLEVGAGGGSIAQWLAKKVGPSGTVVAIDMNVRFLRHLAIPHLEVREHNILNDPLEAGSYDLVHSRRMLMHLREPEKALKKMADALRPGGWLFIEDQDFASTFCIALTDPSLEANLAVAQRLFTHLRNQGIFDPYFGRRERSLVEALGFLDIGHEGWTRIFRGGEPIARITLMTAQALRPMMLSAGVCNEEEFEDLERRFLDPSVTRMDYIMFGAWGRKPNG